MNLRKIAGLVLTPVVCVALLLLGVIVLVLGWGLTTNRTMDHANVDFVFLLGTVAISGTSASTRCRGTSATPSTCVKSATRCTP
ncbi:hypothetical protein ACFQZ4_43970 [Catellatospora coxensis]